MSRIATIFFLAISVAGCDAISTLTDGFKYARAVENDLQKSTGIKPQVGFNWSNGRLVTVTVTFPRLYDAKPLGQLAATVRSAVTGEFKQMPENIVLAFAITNGTGAAAQLREQPSNTQHMAL
jgi:hypothetical protein